MIARSVRPSQSAGDGDAALARYASELVEFAAQSRYRWPHGRPQLEEVIAGLPAQLIPDLLTELVTFADDPDGRYEYDDPDAYDYLGRYDERELVTDLVVAIMWQFPAESPPAAVAFALGEVAQYDSCSTQLLVRLAEVATRGERPLPAPVIAVIRRTAWRDYRSSAALSTLLERIAVPILNCGEAWADQVLADLPGLGGHWQALVAHAATAAGSKPSAGWERRARDLLARIDSDVGQILRSWLSLLGRPRTLPLRGWWGSAAANDISDPFNASTLRGLIWMTALLPAHPETPRVLGAVVGASLRRVAGIGPRDPKLANAAVYALSRLHSEAALGQLVRLSAQVTYKGTLKLIRAALDATAAALNLTREQLEEVAVPTYGLSASGRRVDHFGAASAELVVTGGTTSVTWRTGAGKVVKAPPAAVRAGYPDDLREFRSVVKDIDRMLAVQAERLDRQILARRVWRYRDWRERYLDHPLVGAVARRLIWLVGERPACYADGRLWDLAGNAVVADDDYPVCLWHPLGRDVDEVLGWREWLERHQVTQPFKQAHREVYLPTAAEAATGVYSNRFAAHILRQHQFHALAAVRGWDNRLRLMVNTTYPPAIRQLPQWGLRAEFWIEGVGDEEYTDANSSLTYLYVNTDQVRFYPIGAPSNLAHATEFGYEQWVPPDAEPADPLRLADVPPLVFSEVMRDIDMFVGVASVATDPNWQDGGPAGRFHEYWESYSVGELSATATTRRDLIERLLPSLAIADRATVEGRFLVVRGDLRTYRIHLGSSNILMSPNDQYLCIVPSRSSDPTGDLFLPFEGDRMLSVILSKAILLARDSEITDATIAGQIRRARHSPLPADG